MSILSPRTQLDKLIISIVTDPYSIFQMKGNWSRAGPDKNRDKNYKAVVCRNMQIGHAGSRTTININDKCGCGPSCQADCIDIKDEIIVIYQLNLLCYGSGTCKNGIKLYCIRRKGKTGIVVLI